MRLCVDQEIIVVQTCLVWWQLNFTSWFDEKLQMQMLRMKDNFLSHPLGVDEDHLTRMKDKYLYYSVMKDLLKHLWKENPPLELQWVMADLTQFKKL